MSTEKIEDNPQVVSIGEGNEIITKEGEGESFQELYAESLHEIREGEVIRGRVIQVGPEFVTIDIGFKSEGQVPIGECMDKQGNLVVAVGQEVDVYVGTQRIRRLD